MDPRSCHDFVCGRWVVMQDHVLTVLRGEGGGLGETPPRRQPHGAWLQQEICSVGRDRRLLCCGWTGACYFPAEGRAGSCGVTCVRAVGWESVDHE